LVRAMDSHHFGLCAECTFPEFEPAYETHYSSDTNER
jgi:hypothetical protein